MHSKFLLKLTFNPSREIKSKKTDRKKKNSSSFYGIPQGSKLKLLPGKPINLARLFQSVRNWSLKLLSNEKWFALPKKRKIERTRLKTDFISFSFVRVKNFKFENKKEKKKKPDFILHGTLVFGGEPKSE